MKGKIKQKGVIQIPLLIWIIVSIVVASAGVGAVLYVQNRPTTPTDDVFEETFVIEEESSEEILTVEESEESKESDSLTEQGLEKARIEAEKARAEAERLRREAEELRKTAEEQKQKDIQATQPSGLQITSLKIIPDYIAARIEYQTTMPAKTKLFFWQKDSTKQQIIESPTGLSLTHYLELEELTPSLGNIMSTYNFKIEAIGLGDEYAVKTGSFYTKTYDELSEWGLRLITLNPNLNCELISFGEPDTKEACRTYRKLSGLEDPPILPIVSLYASYKYISYGGNITLSWDSSNVTNCTISSYQLNVFPGVEGSKDVAVSGSISLTNLTVTTVYTLTCKGDSGEASDSVTITVSPPPASSESPPILIPGRI